MTEPALLAEVIRGDMMESQHRGHAVVVDDEGDIVVAFGDPQVVIYPRSSCKMLQALPMIETGAAEAFGIDPERLALACASHSGGAIHTDRVIAWLAEMGLAERDLRCGPQVPDDTPARHGLRADGHAPTQVHNNCSGKHTGFLTLSRHLGGGPEYVDLDHPVQRLVRETFEEMTGAASPHVAIDGCSAPNFACTLHGLAHAMAKMAAPDTLAPKRCAAAQALVAAMMAHPLLVSGDGRACAELTTAMSGKGAVKTGAEGVFTAILPSKRMGIALKVEDGATRASEAAMAALLVRVGALDRLDPAVQRRANAPMLNRRMLHVGHVQAHDALWS